MAYPCSAKGTRRGDAQQFGHPVDVGWTQAAFALRLGSADPDQGEGGFYLIEHLSQDYMHPIYTH